MQTPERREVPAMEDKGKIYNSIPTQPREEKVIDPVEEEDEWGAVPAFLRRSKIK
jgi:hypothetical protein